MVKKLIYTLILIVILSHVLTIRVAAFEDICKIDVITNKDSLEPKQEIQLIFSVKDIKEGIAGIGFSLNYNYDKFEITKVEECDGWMASRLETLFTILTKNFEATTNTGNVLKITLKLKDNVDLEKVEQIVIKNLEVSKDDGSVVKLNDISKSIEIIGNNVKSTGINKKDSKNNNAVEVIVKNPITYICIGAVIVAIVIVVIVIKKNKK